MDKLDVGKLKAVSIDLKKFSDVADNYVFLKKHFIINQIQKSQG